MSDTKNIIVTGGAVEGMTSSGKKRRSRKNHNGGGSTQGAIVQLQLRLLLLRQKFLLKE